MTYSARTINSLCARQVRRDRGQLVPSGDVAERGPGVVPQVVAAAMSSVMVVRGPNEGRVRRRDVAVL